MSEPLTPEEFHDAWVLRGMRCEGTHAVNEALCQNIMAVLATLDAERVASQADSLDVERERLVAAALRFYADQMPAYAAAAGLTQEEYAAVMVDVRRAREYAAPPSEST